MTIRCLFNFRGYTPPLKTGNSGTTVLFTLLRAAGARTSRFSVPHFMIFRGFRDSQPGHIWLLSALGDLEARYLRRGTVVPEFTVFSRDTPAARKQAKT